MRQIKGFLWFMILTSFVVTALVLLSLQSERNYLAHCQTLAIDCEPGRVQRTLTKITTWLEATFTPTPNSQTPKPQTPSQP